MWEFLTAVRTYPFMQYALAAGLLASIACGMVGSAQGWREVPYLELPADLAALASSLARLEGPGGASIWIVPGLMEPGELPGVMRGISAPLLS